ncbi:hypothetical protein GCM10017044_27700 [Kordiimonas sediminis]|uniref:Uncharacterized protein n=1 Tax=Kordiimonas sediminis TaxID=1735581 RepID=A0A919EAP0_9PROT|nr:hypothetical protein [Kordiimonas sediminis]GHF30775.1 hypothetical protein GCM10017044_27700 [Kordiimonas sediminis]
MNEVKHWDWETPERPHENLREAVAVFTTMEDMQQAVDDLECHGFATAAMSRPKHPEIVETAIGHAVKSVRELEDDPEVPREAYTDPDSQMSGMMISLLVPTYVLLLAGMVISVSYGFQIMQIAAMTLAMGLIGIGLGGMVAARLYRSIQNRRHHEEKLGGYLLWVRTGSRAQELSAMSSLKQHNALDVHMHGAY